MLPAAARLVNQCSSNPEKHVEDRQFQGFRVLPHGMDLEADPAPLQGDDRFFHRRRGAAKFFHLLAVDQLPVARIEHTVTQSQIQELGLHFIFGLHIVALPSPYEHETAEVEPHRRALARPVRTFADRRRSAATCECANHRRRHRS